MSNHMKRERSEVDRGIRELIVTLLKLSDTAPEDIEGNQPNFFANLGATSIDTLELFLAVEQRFGFQFDETELNPGLLITLDSFVDFVYAKLGANPGI